MFTTHPTTESRTPRRRRHHRLAVLAALGALAPATAVHAAGNHRIDLTAAATVTDEGWRLTLAGTATGRPFDSALYGAVRPSTGGWPSAGACVSGDAGFALVGPGDKRVSIVTVGEVCRRGDDTAYVFSGDFDTWDSKPRGLDDTQGTYSVVVTDDGQATVRLESL
jgi:hypothetical protein